MFLNVPYAEKNEAKSLGAKWNPQIKKWYIDTESKNYINFAKWILNVTDDAIIACEYIYIVEGQQKCWRCRKTTRVISLGINQYIEIYGEPDQPEINCYVDSEELHLAWVNKEEDIPPKLLKYIKGKYSVKMGYSKTLEDMCFANHCDCCGALQGNYFLFDEPSSPFLSFAEGKRLETKMSKLKIYGIPIEDDLQLNWDLSFSDNDYAYLEYGKFEELILSSDPQNEYISYKELYEL